MGDQAMNIIPFPHPHRGDPEPHRQALAQIGFRWTGGAWRRGPCGCSRPLSPLAIPANRVNTAETVEQRSGHCRYLPSGVTVGRRVEPSRARSMRGNRR